MKLSMMTPAILIASAPLTANATADLLDGLGGPDGFGDGELEANDDDSSPSIDLDEAFPDGLSFFGRSHREIFVNNNGNVSFGSSVSAFTPEAFPVSAQPMIAPWWADVDTRLQTGGIANKVYYHVDNRRGRFIATWYEVGYFSFHTDLSNSFQLVLTDRSDVAPGDFDIEFRYNRCEWAVADPPATGGGGLAAQAGFDAGNRRDFVVLPGSMTEGVLELCDTTNTDEVGVWRFFVRVGDITQCGNAIVEDDEACDEGATTATCDGDCTEPLCGDGYLNEAAGEECEDGNEDNGDGCSDVCTIEPEQGPDAAEMVEVEPEPQEYRFTGGGVPWNCAQAGRSGANPLWLLLVIGIAIGRGASRLRT
jgi:cysteine-rich repeat protein